MKSKLKIKVGSTNPAKISAVREILKDYPHFKGAKVLDADVSSGVGEQPKSLNETLKGAMNRAKNSFFDCNYSFGIESGLMKVPFTKSGFMDVCTCAIFDGKEFHLGLSSAWEAPKEVMEHILSGLDMNQAAFKAKLTKNPKVGSAEGLLGIVTKGRLDRKKHAQEAIRTALIHLER